MPSVPESAILTATIPGINEMWSQLLFLAARQDHARGTSLYLYDDPEHSFYFLEKGRITILHGAANGRIQNMLYMQPGTLLNVAHALGSARELSPGISQTELANILGIHRISLLRVIQKLKRDGVIRELTKDRLVITNLERLRELAMQ